MFDHFSGSARSVVFRARDIAQSKGGTFIEPKHILLALVELHPNLFEKLVDNPIDLRPLRIEIAQSTTPSRASFGATKLRFNEQSKLVMQVATREAHFCWEHWEAGRRKHGQLLPEDQSYWESRLRRSIPSARFSQWLVRWMLRRTWEVDERHLLLGLLMGGDYPGVSVLTAVGVTFETARQRLCAPEG